MRLTVDAPQLEHGVPSDTDTPSGSTGPPPSRRQRPLREVLANGTVPGLLERAASLSGSDQEQTPDSAHRLPSGAGPPCHHCRLPFAQMWVVAASAELLVCICALLLPEQSGTRPPWLPAFDLACCCAALLVCECSKLLTLAPRYSSAGPYISDY